MRVSPGLICLVREMRFVAPNTKHNQRKAQELMERFSELWADAFDGQQSIAVGMPWKTMVYEYARKERK